MYLLLSILIFVNDAIRLFFTYFDQELYRNLLVIVIKIKYRHFFLHQSAATSNPVK